MGWLILLGLAALVALGIGYFARRDKGALQFLMAALLLALAGYSWQGRPGLAGAPKQAVVRQALPDSDFANLRGDLLGRFDRAWTWMNIADGYQRRGDSEGAARVLRQGLRSNPRSADLWVAYGYALVVHGDGQMTPASQLAFSRAAQIAPDHPGPRFFYGLALAQGGNYDEAERVWREVLTAVPPESQYRSAIEERLRAIAQARATGQIPAPVPPPQTPPVPTP